MKPKSSRLLIFVLVIIVVAAASFVLYAMAGTVDGDFVVGALSVITAVIFFFLLFFWLVRRASAFLREAGQTVSDVLKTDVYKTCTYKGPLDDVCGETAYFEAEMVAVDINDTANSFAGKVIFLCRQHHPFIGEQSHATYKLMKKRGVGIFSIYPIANVFRI